MMLLLLVVVLLFFVLLVLLLLLLLLLSRGPYGRLASGSICYTLKTKLLLVLFVLSRIREITSTVNAKKWE